MAFRLKRRESVADGVRRIVRRQIDDALDNLQSRADEAVHDARKCFKRVRAVLRLVGDGLGNEAYDRENACFRDAGRPLTEVRDAEALVEAIDRFDPAKGATFEQYAWTRVSGSIVDELRRQDWVSRSTRRFGRKIDQTRED